MFGRLSQRKAVQRLSGVGSAATAVAYAFALTGAGQLFGAALYADGSSSFVPFKLDVAGNNLPTNRAPTGFAVSPNGEWLALNIYSGGGATDAAGVRIFRRTGDRAFTHFASLGVSMADELRFNTNTTLIQSARNGYPAYWTFNGTAWAAGGVNDILDQSYQQWHGGLGLSSDPSIPIRCGIGRFASDTWNMGFCATIAGVRSNSTGFGQTIDQFNNVKSLVSPANARVLVLSSTYDGYGYARVLTRSGTNLTHQSTMQPARTGQPYAATWISETQLLIACTPYNIPPTNQPPYVGQMLSLQVCDVATYQMGTPTPILNLVTMFGVQGNKVMDVIRLPGSLFAVVTDDFQFAIVSVSGFNITLVGSSALTFPKPYAAAFYRAS